jgi:hypothetical protein
MPDAESPPAPVVSLSEPTSTPASTRVMSVDALRGFDMFWIAGGGPLVMSLAAVLCHPNPAPAWLVHHMRHVEWTGFSAWDLIMPLFLFLSGVSIPFAYARRLDTARDYRAIYRRMARRFVLLWILGMIAQGNLLQVLWGWLSDLAGQETGLNCTSFPTRFRPLPWGMSSPPSPSCILLRANRSACARLCSRPTGPS